MIMTKRSIDHYVRINYIIEMGCSKIVFELRFHWYSSKKDIVTGCKTEVLLKLLKRSERERISVGH